MDDRAASIRQGASRRAPIIVDCDTGIDDALALLLAAASPDCDLVAATCSAGNVDLAQVVENTRAVLELAGRTDVEVAAGRDRPLVRPLVITPETHGPRGIGYAELPRARMSLSTRSSAELIAAEAHRRPGELTVVAVAPLTNVALAVLREPALPSLLRRLVIMGGSYRTPGNTAPTTEWNAHSDPEAARIVFDAWSRAAEADEAVLHPIALGLDVTERAKLTPEHLDRLASAVGCRPDGSIEGGGENAVMRFVADALRFYMEFHSRYDGFYGAFVHDPLALATALDPSLVRTEALAVDVELAGSLTAGETVADWRRAWQKPPNVDVAVETDAARFFDLFVERIAALALSRAGAATV